MTLIQPRNNVVGPVGRLLEKVDRVDNIDTFNNFYEKFNLSHSDLFAGVKWAYIDLGDLFCAPRTGSRLGFRG